MTTRTINVPTEISHLLSPLNIAHPGGTLELRNRVLVSAHVPGFADDNKPGQQFVDYHCRYAAEGVGLQITGGTPVHHSGLLGLGKDGLRNLDDSISRVINAWQKRSTKKVARFSLNGRPCGHDMLLRSFNFKKIGNLHRECWSH